MVRLWFPFWLSFKVNFSDTLWCLAWAAFQRQLSEVRGQLPSKGDDHDVLRTAVGLVFDDLRVALAVETSSLALAREVLHTGVHRAFTIAHSHYIDIDLPMIIEGFAPGYTDAELDEIQKEAEPPARDLEKKFEEEILPKNVN